MAHPASVTSDTSSEYRAVAGGGRDHRGHQQQHTAPFYTAERHVTYHQPTRYGALSRERDNLVTVRNILRDTSFEAQATGMRL